MNSDAILPWLFLSGFVAVLFDGIVTLLIVRAIRAFGRAEERHLSESSIFSRFGGKRMKSECMRQ